MNSPSVETDSARTGRAARFAAIAIGGLAIAVGITWLTFTFLRFGPLDLAPGIWDDYLAWGLDYRAYYDAAGRLAEAGTPYAADLVASSFESGPTGLYYYSPVLATTLLPVAKISFTDSSVWWFAAQMASLVGACLLMPVRPLTRALAFTIVAFSLPVFKDVIYGNVSTMLLLPIVVAWRWMDRPSGSLALAFAISIRPTMGLLLLWQLLRRRWRAVVWTLAGGLAIVIVTLPLVGLAGYEDYLAVLRNLNIPLLQPGTDSGWENRDLGQLVRSAGASAEAMGVVRLGSAAVAIGAMLLSLRRDREISFMVTLMASMLVVPLLWDHYLTMLIIPAAFLADRWRPVALLLPLLAWLPSIAAVTIALAMILPFFVRDARTQKSGSPDVVSGAREPHRSLPNNVGSV